MPIVPASIFLLESLSTPASRFWEEKNKNQPVRKVAASLAHRRRSGCRGPRNAAASLAARQRGKRRHLCSHALFRNWHGMGSLAPTLTHPIATAQLVWRRVTNAKASVSEQLVLLRRASFKRSVSWYISVPGKNQPELVCECTWSHVPLVLLCDCSKSPASSTPRTSKNINWWTYGACAGQLQVYQYPLSLSIFIFGFLLLCSSQRRCLPG